MCACEGSLGDFTGPVAEGIEGTQILCQEWSTVNKQGLTLNVLSYFCVKIGA